jgi:hypothetical protein
VIAVVTDIVADVGFFFSLSEKKNLALLLEPLHQPDIGALPIEAATSHVPELPQQGT